jgi:hypothetical protein
MRRACVVCVVLVACTGVKGSGKPGSEVRQLAAFDRVELAGSFEVDVGFGSAQRVEVTGDDNLVPLVTTEVTGSTMRVKTSKAVRPQLDLVVHVVMPRLAMAEVSGSGQVTVHGLAADDVKLSVRSSGKIAIDGVVKHVDAAVSGSGDLDAAALVAERAGAVVSGSGSIELQVTQSLFARVSGSGSVHYAGNPPDVKKDITGSGSVTQR